MRNLLTLAVIGSTLITSSIPANLSAGNWRQFRGDATTSVVAEAEGPGTDLKIAWSTPLPGRGLSSPIIVGDRVFVSSASGYRQDRLHVACYKAADGELLWERQFWATGRTVSHPKTCNAAPTPASDGKRIFALFSSNDLICVDLDGQLQWVRGLMVDFPNASNSLGMAQSPIVVGGTLVVPIENDSQSLALGIDPATGMSRWTVSRPQRANWTSPALLPGPSASGDLVLLQSSAGLSAVHPLTGETVWTFDNGASTIPSSTVHEGKVYVPSNGLTALGTGSANPEVLWNESKLGPGTASPIVVRDQVLVLNRAGVLLGAELASGKTLWQKRLEGPFSSSPVAAGDNIYFVNEQGLTQIVKLGEKEGDVASSLDLGETVLCTPSLANGGLYVRSDKTLWKLSRP